MRQTHQVVIVGAGPAGSVTALLLASAGVDVLLLERASLPREKACGDCLSAQATHVLAGLGVLDTILERGAARLAGWRIRGPRRSGFEARFDQVAGACDALAWPRAQLDAVLLDAAVAAGAQLRSAAHVTEVLGDARRVHGVRFRADGAVHEAMAALTVGADGLRSTVARRLDVLRRSPRLRKVSLTAHLPLDRARDGFGEMHVADGVCVGIAPVSSTENLWNVTVVADAARYGRELALDPRAFHARALRQATGCNADPGTGRLLASGPFDLPMRRVTVPGAALVGDAAGYYDPFTGQGVYQAMAGAALLVDAVLPALTTGRAPVGSELDRYGQAHRGLTGGARRVQHVIEAVLSRPRLATSALNAIAARPRLARTLLAVTGDLLPARSLLSPRLLLKGSLHEHYAQ